MVKEFLGTLLGCGAGQPEFITRHGINDSLEKMFKEATREIIIVSPYIKIHQQTRELLLERKAAGVSVTIVHREDFADKDIADRIFTRSQLHSKCYLTDRAALVSSMNFYEYSQANNDEMGILVIKAACPKLYTDVSNEVQHLCKNFPDSCVKCAPVKAKTTVASTSTPTQALDPVLKRDYIYSAGDAAYF